MRVLYALICEDASTRAGRAPGRRTASSTSSTRPASPRSRTGWSLAVALEWDAGESGRQDFRIDLLDPEPQPHASPSTATPT